MPGHWPACGQVRNPELVSCGQGGPGMNGCQGLGETP